MAVGIMGFAFVAILGLVPVGLASFRETKNAGTSSQISQQIVAQAQVAPFATLTQPTPNNPYVIQITNSQNVTSVAFCVPSPPEPATSSYPYVRFFNDQGVEVLSTDVTGIYWTNTRILVGPAFVQTGTNGSANADVAVLTIQVAYNPSRLALDISRSTDLCLGTANNGTVPVPVVSFQVNVARNF